MKDIFARRARDTFLQTLTDFVDSLSIHFPDCAGVQKWKEWLTTLEGEEDKQRCMESWIGALQEPLAKKSAKYIRAVKSITDNDAVVYHAVVYHDVDAIMASSDYLRSFDLSHKVQNMTPENVVILWQYLEELAQYAFTSTRRIPPRVPTTDEISLDIAKRKRGPQTPLETGNLKTGLNEMWGTLCAMRQVAPPDLSVDVLAAQLNQISKYTVDDTLMNELCTRHDGRAFCKIVEVFPFLDNSCPFSADEWALFEKCMAVSTMHSNIPAPMMQGIEDVADKLVADIQSGKTDLASLNVEAIGRQVLSGVSEGDISEFAKNMGNILPSMHL